MTTSYVGKKRCATSDLEQKEAKLLRLDDEDDEYVDTLDEDGEEEEEPIERLHRSVVKRFIHQNKPKRKEMKLIGVDNPELREMRSRGRGGDEFVYASSSSDSEDDDQIKSRQYSLNPNSPSTFEGTQQAPCSATDEMISQEIQHLEAEIAARREMATVKELIAGMIEYDPDCTTDVKFVKLLERQDKAMREEAESRRRTKEWREEILSTGFSEALLGMLERSQYGDEDLKEELVQVKEVWKSLQWEGEVTAAAPIGTPETQQRPKRPYSNITKSVAPKEDPKLKASIEKLRVIFGERFEYQTIRNTLLAKKGNLEDAAEFLAKSKPNKFQCISAALEPAPLVSSDGGIKLEENSKHRSASPTRRNPARKAKTVSMLFNNDKDQGTLAYKT